MTGDPRICGFTHPSTGGVSDTNKWKEGERSSDTSNSGNCQRMVRVPQAAADCEYGEGAHDGRD